MKKLSAIVFVLFFVFMMVGCENTPEEKSHYDILDLLWETYVIEAHEKDMLYIEEIDQIILMGTSYHIANLDQEQYLYYTHYSKEEYRYGLEMLVTFKNEGSIPIHKFTFNLRLDQSSILGPKLYGGNLEILDVDTDLETYVANSKEDILEKQEEDDAFVQDGILEDSTYESLYIEERFNFEDFKAYIPNITDVVEQDHLIYTIYDDQYATLSSYDKNYVFDELNVLSEIDNKPVTKIGNGALEDLEADTVMMPSSIEVIGDKSFFNAIINQITIPASVTEIGSSSFFQIDVDNFLFEENSKLESIGNHAFINSHLSKITIPASVKHIGDKIFKDTHQLTEINVESNNMNYTSIDGVLFNKEGTRLIAFPANKEIDVYEVPSLVEIIESYAFFGSKHVKSITFDDDSNLKTIGDFAFSVTYIEDMFIPKSVKSIGKDAFIQNYYLASIEVDSLNNTYTSIDGILYNKDISTLILYPSMKTETSYEIPNTVTSIEDYAVSYNKFLKSITFETNAQITNIGMSAFSFSDLDSIIIPKDVEKISKVAFYGNPNLVIYVNEEEQPSRWSVDWNISELEVVWGYSGDQNES